MVIKYDKLIRDNIPEIIKQAGKTCVTEMLSDEEYGVKLADKLSEEMNEFLTEFKAERDEKAIAELADVAEVMYALVDFMGYDMETFEKIRAGKKYTNGGFEKRLLLKEVIED